MPSPLYLVPDLLPPACRTHLFPGPIGFDHAPKRPTCKVRPGICTESLALEVALECRVPSRVICRAAELATYITPSSELVAASKGELGGSAGATASEEEQTTAAARGNGGDTAAATPGHGCEAVRLQGHDAAAEPPEKMRAAADILREIAARAAAVSAVTPNPAAASAGGSIRDGGGKRIEVLFAGPGQRLQSVVGGSGGCDGRKWAYIYALRWRESGAWSAGGVRDLDTLRVVRRRARAARGMADMAYVAVARGSAAWTAAGAEARKRVCAEIG
jgi:hypothetical protein